METHVTYSCPFYIKGNKTTRVQVIVSSQHFLPKGGATTELAQACAGALSYCVNVSAPSLLTAIISYTCIHVTSVVTTIHIRLSQLRNTRVARAQGSEPQRRHRITHVAERWSPSEPHIYGLNSIQRQT